MIKNNLQSPGFVHLYLPNTETPRLLLTSVGFSVVLLLARTVYTGGLTFAFLLWNLFLAFLPWLLSHSLAARPAWTNKKWKLVLVVTAWLLFVPNSFYMLTDLFHLYDNFSVPRWYDLLLILSFAWNATLMGILSVRNIEKFLEARWRYRRDVFFVYPIMLLNALGIYIGRYMRFNSWDVVSNPFALVAGMAHLLLHPFYYRNGWAMIACFSFFLTILYRTLKKLSRAI